MPYPEIEMEDEDPDFEKRNFPHLSPEWQMTLKSLRGPIREFLASNLGHMGPRLTEKQKAKQAEKEARIATREAARQSKKERPVKVKLSQTAN